MGTRSLTCVVQEGEFKVAQYCQWDGYPEGQGRTIYNFLKEISDKIGKFKILVSGITEITEEELRVLWVECGAESDNEWVDKDTSKEMKRRWPHFQRDLGANILYHIMAGDIEKVQKHESFASDSLFCEWCYVLDLDNDALEVYEGFIKKPHEGERFSHLFKEVEHRGDQYYPVKLVCKFPFYELPETFEEFALAIHLSMQENRREKAEN